MEENFISVISLLVSIAAFIFGGYSLWLTRKDRKSKLKLIEDYTMAIPLLEINLDDFITVSSLPEELTYNKINKLWNAVTKHPIHFNHTTTEKNFRLLVERLGKILNENPEYLIEKKKLPQSDEDREKYKLRIVAFIRQWHKFIHNLRVRTSIKDL